MTAPESVCGSTMSHCRCSKGAEPHDVHACTDISPATPSGRCHGQWRDDGTIVQYPTGAWDEAEARVHALLVMLDEPLPPVRSL